MAPPYRHTEALGDTVSRTVREGKHLLNPTEDVEIMRMKVELARIEAKKEQQKQ